MPSKSFPIAVILNFADGRLLTSIEDVYTFANFMTGDSLFTHQLPRAFREISPVLKKQLPFLASPEFAKDQEILTRSLDGAARECVRPIIDDWLKDVAGSYGAEHMVTPLTEWMRQDPVSELIQMRESREGIVVVQAPEPQS